MPNPQLITRHELGSYIEILADLERDVLDAYRTLLANKAAQDYLEAIARRDTLQGLIDDQMGRVTEC